VNTDLHSESLSAGAQTLARQIGDADWSEEFYLAGSAAMALHLGHRPVSNLDLMSPTQRLRPPDRRDVLGELLAIDPDVRVETARDGYLYARSETGIGVRFFYYPYPLIDPVSTLAQLEVASLADLGLMKLAAIISRGTRRDFVDLYLMCRDLPFASLLERAPQKFGHVRDFPLQALKGVSDLSLVDGEPMPALTSALEWSTIESWVREVVHTSGARAVGLK